MLWSLTWTDAPGGSTTFQDKKPVGAATKYWAARKATVDTYQACYSNVVTFPGICVSPPTYFGPAAAQYNCPAQYTHSSYGIAGDPCYNPNPTTIVNTVNGGISKFRPVSSILDRATEECVCPEGTLWVPERYQCHHVDAIEYSGPKSCNANPSFGNPIYPLTGAKKQGEKFDFGIGWINFQITYNNERSIAINDPTVVLGDEIKITSFGNPWFSNLHKFLLLGPTTSGYDEHTDRWSIRAVRDDGRIVSFEKPVPYSGYRLAGGGSRDSIVQTNTGFNYYDQEAGVIESYDKFGRVLRMVRQSGESLSFSYITLPSSINSPASTLGYLQDVTDSFGRRLRFSYAKVSGKYLVASIKHSVAGIETVALTASYAGGRLSSVVQADGTSRKYIYSPQAGSILLTDVIDELGVNYSKFTYDSYGRAVSTELAGGVQRYSITYGSVPSRVAVDTFDPVSLLIRRRIQFKTAGPLLVSHPMGAQIILNGTDVGGQPAIQSSSQPAGAGCAASNKALEYNPDLSVSRSSDFAGNHSCFAYGGARRSELSRVEGLPATSNCATVLMNGASLPVGSQKISREWHSDWELVTKSVEPGRITRFVYNGQPDPYLANAVATCAPSTALLPDGKPIAVVCAKYEQATSDVDGSQGAAAQPQTDVLIRAHRWTYNGLGQILSHQDPLGHISTYTYYSDTVFIGTGNSATGHNIGDLAKVTRPLQASGEAQYTKYNKAGQLLEMIDENNVAHSYAYDYRQRLINHSIAGQITAFEYWPTGTLRRVTLPDGSFYSHDYDQAHRLTSIQDNLGNRIAYTLDNSGQRIEEAVIDSTGELRRVVLRRFDALGRVQQVTGRE